MLCRAPTWRGMCSDRSLFLLRHAPDLQAWRSDPLVSSTAEAPVPGNAGSPSPAPVAHPPAVSVVMANHNGARFIEAAIASVLAQSLSDIELLVADDASTDDSAERVAAIASRDARVRLLRAACNGGPGAARNRALDAARGRWIAVVDSDDLLHPDRLEQLLAGAEADGADIAADNMLVFDDAARMPPVAALRGAMGEVACWVDAAAYVRSNALTGRGPALGYLKPLFRTATLRRLDARYDPSLRIAEDYDLVARLLVAGAHMRTYPQLTYFYRKHGASVSHRLSRDTLLPMLTADDSFRARLRASGGVAAGDLCDAGPAGAHLGGQVSVPPIPAASTARELMRALDRRRASILDALAFDSVITALKTRSWRSAAGILLGRPRTLPLLTVPVRDRVRRALRSPPSSAGAPRPARVCVLSRQRVVGAVNGSSAYLLGLCGALRDAGYEIDLVSPSPAVFGRWPALTLRPEMAVFRSIRVRGAWRLGSRLFVARNPRVAGAAAAAVADRLLHRFGLALSTAKAPLAIAVPWTAADHLFVARHARGADLVLADYAFLAAGAPFTLSPATPVAVVMHDLFSAARIGGAPPIIEEADEMRLLARADAIIAIQAEEAAAVRRHLPDARMLIAPMAVPTVAAPQPGEDDRTVLFVASDTAANREGLRWFLASCWPAIRAERPYAELLVAGSVANAVAERPEGVRFLGRVPSLEALYRKAAVVVSPLRSGSGLKIKLVEALANGKAVVATSTTLQGVEEIAGTAVAWADDAPGFAAATVGLLRNRAAREAHCTAALAVAARHFSPQACYGALLRFADEACGRPDLRSPATAPSARTTVRSDASSTLKPAAIR